MYIFKFIFILFLAVWVLVASCGLSLVVVSGGYSLIEVCGVLIAVASLVAKPGSRFMGFSHCGPWAPERRLGSHGLSMGLIAP